MGIKRKPKKKLGNLRSSGASGSSGAEMSSRRPSFVEKTPPCQNACPQGTDIRGILRTIADGEKHDTPREETFQKVFELLTENNPLPSVCGRVCPHPCEVACNRNSVDDAAAINNVERFVGDWGLEKGIPLPKPETSYDEHVAVIGAGPAGLSCAYHLAKRGYPVTIYEAFPKPGGMLRYGIPSYRLPHDVIDGEVQRILDLGVELKCGVSVGKDISLDDLRAKHAVTFVGIGAHKGRLLGVDGENAPNVWTGTSFLNHANQGEAIEVGKKVLVIGGGDTAVDAARVARRMGADVTIVYRRTRTEMPAIDEEIVGAEEEKVLMHFLAAPMEIHTDADGRATAMRCQQMELGEPDDSGRRRPVPIEGQEFTIEADTIIAAISQEPDFDGLEDVKAGPKDWVKADEHGATSMEDVFAGGDALDLGLVTIAIAQGRLAAVTIHEKLRGLEPEARDEPGLITPERMALSYYEKILRNECSELSAESRLEGFDEIKRTYTEDEVVAEAARCLSCGSCFDCGTCWSYCQDGAIVKPVVPGEPYRLKLDVCKGCDKCAQNCPCGYIEMIDPAAVTN